MVPRLASLLRPMRSLVCRLHSWNSAFLSGSVTYLELRALWRQELWKWAVLTWCNTIKLVADVLACLWRTSLAPLASS